MRTEDILRIYQSYSLAKISALNKQQLIAQYAQCEQLEQLNRQLESSNETNRKLLDNQIRELKRQEKLRYYKTLAFNLNQSLQAIASHENKNFKIFLGTNFLKPIEILANDAASNLEEITDKEYASNIALRASTLLTSGDYCSPQYTQSPWYSYTQTELSINQKELENLKGTLSELQSRRATVSDKSYFLHILRKLFFVCALGILMIAILGTILDICDGGAFDTTGIGVLIFSTILFTIAYLVSRNEKKKSRNDKELYEGQVNDINSKIIAIESKGKQHLQELNSLKSSMSGEVPDWEQIVAKIAESLPANAEEEAHRSIDHSLGFNSNLDEKFKDAATYVVTTQKVSSSSLQRKLSIGFARTARILGQLEIYGIISPSDAEGKQKVLCPDLTELNRILGE